MCVAPPPPPPPAPAAAGRASVRGIDLPVVGAAKIVADTNTEGSLNRSLSSGLLFAGLCYLIYKDENWALNGALGVSASYVADIAVPAREKEKEDDY